MVAQQHASPAHAATATTTHFPHASQKATTNPTTITTIPNQTNAVTHFVQRSFLRCLFHAVAHGAAAASSSALGRRSSDEV